MKHPLKTLDKKRLRRWLLLFFLALLLPTALLIQQSYSRLKWETFHQHQLTAAELSERIDNRLIQMISAEDQRPFNDFSFLKTPEVSNSKIIQRSPLSEFPVRSDIPGLLGYFQVDASGQLLTPILPTANQTDYGIPETELSERSALQNEILGILAANKLAQRASVSKTKPVLTQQASPGLSMQNSIAQESISILSSSDLSNSGTSHSNMPDSKIDSEITSYSIPESEAKRDSLADAMPGADMEEIDDAQAVTKLSKAEEAPAAQMKQAAPIAFDQLKEISKQSSKKKDLGRVEDLKLQQNYLQEESESTVKRKSARLQKKTTARQRQTRPTAAMTPPVNSNTRVLTFESEIDPFEFSQLDSGHFVLFRKVWLNGQRYTQGLLIDQNRFLTEIINDKFIQTSLSTMSDLLVAYQGNVLTAFSGEQNQGYSSNTRTIVDTQRGEQLYQIRLSDPVSDLQLIYSITQLPIGSGGQLLLWLSLVLGTVLLGGFYLMYRLGLGQINLANQQQDFVSAVSHELKTPLTSIRMYGELLREGWATEEKKQTYYQFIFDESERLTRLINNVLQLARMTRNEQKAELTERNVAELVQEIKSRISSQIETAGFDLKIETDESLATNQIQIDNDWLIQIMINLVDNALKFSAKAKQKTIILGVKRVNKQHVQFMLSDFGPGIDKQQMKKIFELFYRSENELTRDTVGTGIGLSLVHQMVTGMGGTVRVENRGRTGEFPGAAFSVTFPIHT